MSGFIYQIAEAEISEPYCTGILLIQEKQFYLIFHNEVGSLSDLDIL
jgi:hypothetical protein